MLAGDAMQALAFEVLTPDADLVPPALQAKLCSLLARAAGHAGMAGGQAIDLASVGVSLDEAATVVMPDQSGELLRLDEALKSLAEMDPRRSQVVELRYFGGLNNEEIAGVLRISENTVTRDWNMARAWLYQQLTGSGAN